VTLQPVSMNCLLCCGCVSAVQNEGARTQENV
jgi:hypothetical protein